MTRVGSGDGLPGRAPGMTRLRERQIGIGISRNTVSILVLSEGVKEQVNFIIKCNETNRQSQQNIYCYQRFGVLYSVFRPSWPSFVVTGGLRHYALCRLNFVMYWLLTRHVAGMNNNRTPKIMLNYRTYGRRWLGRRFKRLLDEAETGLSRPNSWQMMTMTNC